jgi:hypothetical protein
LLIPSWSATSETPPSRIGCCRTRFWRMSLTVALVANAANTVAWLGRVGEGGSTTSGGSEILDGSERLLLGFGDGCG